MSIRLIYMLSAVQTLAGGVHAPEPFQFFHRGITGNNNGSTVSPGQLYSEVLGNRTLIVENFLGLQFAPAAGARTHPAIREVSGCRWNWGRQDEPLPSFLLSSHLLCRLWPSILCGNDCGLRLSTFRSKVAI
jgi:hypothetical protein